MVENFKKRTRNWYHNTWQISFLLCHSQQSTNKTAVLKLNSSRQLHDQLRHSLGEAEKDYSKKGPKAAQEWSSLMAPVHVT